jgi:hypothetical protein
MTLTASTTSTPLTGFKSAGKIFVP